MRKSVKASLWRVEQGKAMTARDAPRCPSELVMKGSPVRVRASAPPSEIAFCVASLGSGSRFVGVALELDLIPVRPLGDDSPSVILELTNQVLERR